MQPGQSRSIGSWGRQKWSSNWSKYGNNYCSIAEAMEIGLVGASPDSPGGQEIKNMLEMAGDRAEAENALV